MLSVLTRLATVAMLSGCLLTGQTAVLYWEGMGNELTDALQCGLGPMTTPTVSCSPATEHEPENCLLQGWNGNHQYRFAVERIGDSWVGDVELDSEQPLARIGWDRRRIYRYDYGGGKTAECRVTYEPTGWRAVLTSR